VVGCAAHSHPTGSSLGPGFVPAKCYTQRPLGSNSAIAKPREKRARNPAELAKIPEILAG
jgi:hypothetical protein